MIGPVIFPRNRPITSGRPQYGSVKKFT